MSRDDGLAGEGPDVLQESLDHRCEMCLDCGAAQLVAFQPGGSGLRRSRGATRQRVPDSQHEPAPGWNIPVQPSLLVYPVCQILDRRGREALRPGNDRPLGSSGNRSRPRHNAGEILAPRKRLGRVEILDPPEVAVRIRRWCRACQHDDVAIEVLRCRRLRQRRVEVGRAFEDALTDHDPLRRLVRFDPRPAAARPAGIVVHVDLESQPVGLRHHVPEHRAPRFGHEAMGAGRIAHVAVHEQQAPDAGSLHGLQIGGDALARDIAFEPETIDPRSGRSRRRHKLRGQVSAASCPRQTLSAHIPGLPDIIWT